MSVPQSIILKEQHRFPLTFYFRIANQFIGQAKFYKDEGNFELLNLTLDRYCRLYEVIAQHHSYSTHSTKEKLRHNKIYQEFVEERETLKSYSHGFPSENGYALSNVSNCDSEIAETRRQSRSINNEKSGLMSIQLENSTTSSFPWDYASPSSSNAASKSLNLTVHTVTQSSPSPVLSCVENAPQDSHVSRIIAADSNNGCSESSSESLLSKTLQDVHISGRLMEEFLELAGDNTKKDLETCGVLGAFLEKGTFYVTTLIIPKQEATSSTCQAIREEEIFAIQNERSLFPVGWIHTHPSQSCFMSSVDLHTQYSYQVMVAEAFAIVMAPTDTTRSSGIFRLSDPGGMSILNECQERGFHSHEELPNGSPIYEDCSNVYINSNIRFEIFDLR